LNLRIDSFDLSQPEHFDFGPTTNGSSHVQICRGDRSSGKYETRQRLKFLVCGINPAFELLDPFSDELPLGGGPTHSNPPINLIFRDFARGGAYGTKFRRHARSRQR
jgi:hypothetical protein